MLNKLIEQEVRELRSMPKVEKEILIETLQLWADDQNPVAIAGKYLKGAFDYMADHPNMKTAMGVIFLK